MILRPWSRRLCHALAAGLLALAAPATARDLTPAEQTGLQERVDRFERAFEQGDMGAVFTVIPPKILANAAEQSGMSEDGMLAAMEEALTRAMAAATVEEYEIDLAAATTGQTAAGRVYVLIPTTVVIRFDGQSRTRRSDTQTLAFEEGGTWYLVRIDDAQQVQFLEDAYPEFEGVTLSQDSTAQDGE